MMRLLPVVLLIGVCGCKATETEATDETDVVIDDSHPLVPEEFQNLWNLDGACSNEFGSGDQMYMIFDGRVEADGTLTGTERVWWFYADEPQESDCMDTFELAGVAEWGEPGSLGCASCEEFYYTRRTLTADGCKERYRSIYRTDDDGLYQRLMFDTTNEFNDAPNENNKVGVFHEEKKWGGQNYVTKLYAAENGSLITPDGDDVYGPPADYRWIGRRCQVSWGG